VWEVAQVANKLFDLSGRTALVTGGAQGLGRAIALGLAREGADVAVADRNETGAAETAAAIAALGRRSAAFACDVAREEDVRRAVAGMLKTLGQIDVLVNNAGITKRIALFDWQQADWEEVIRVNQVGTFLVAREVGRHMVSRKRGSIVNMSALGGGVVGLGRGNAVYCSTKGAVLALTRELAAEWAQHGVRVNCIAPGWFCTEMNAPLLKSEGLLQRILDRVPLGRMGEPEDVVGPVVFLASDAAAMITGHIMPIDGGVASIVSLTNEAVVR
jgi:NAD(P)-dependent dehydrogenase (short-subunit alcohol dehydrogenase family)